MPEPDEPSQSELMKTQGLFVVIRLFLFLAVILLALLIFFTFARMKAYSGGSVNNPPVERTEVESRTQH
jgi:hypothetical protein